MGFHRLYGLLRWLSDKEFACQCRRHTFDLWVRKMLWSRKWLPTPVFLPGKSHGWRSLAGYSPYDHKESNANEWACTDCAKVAHQLPLKQEDQPGLLNMLTVIPWALNSRKERPTSQIFAEEDEAGEAKSKKRIQSPLLLITHDESRQWGSEWPLGNKKQENRDFSSVTSKNSSPSTPEWVWKLPPLGTSRKEPRPATTFISALWNLKQRSQMNRQDYWPSELWNT